jgi:hypothetical protein
LKSRSLVTFLSAISFCYLLSPVSHSAQNISGQVLFNGQPSANFNVLLWRNDKSDSELSVSKKLVKLNLEVNATFTIPPDAQNFTVILVSSGDNLKKPLILYDFENQKLISKIVLSDTPQLDHNIRFENQDNAISLFGVSNYINKNPVLLLKGTTYVHDPTGIKVPISATAELPKIWSQEADAFNEKISRLRNYALDNSSSLTEDMYLVNLSQSLSLLSIPRELLYVASAQIHPEEDVTELESSFMEISNRILMKNRAFVDRVMSLMSIVNSLIDLNPKKIIASKREQQIIWEKPTFTTIALSKDPLSLRLSATSKLKIEIGSYNQDVCGVVDNKVILISTGTCSLYVLQGGDSEFLPTPPFKLDFVVQSPVVKKSTITCVKGKLTKKVTAVKPKCPAGYKVKK